MKKLFSTILAGSMALSMVSMASAQEIQPAELDQVALLSTKTSGTILLSSDYADISAFSEGFATVTTHDGRVGVINANGNEVVIPSTKYSSIGNYNDGMAAFAVVSTIDPEYYSSVGYLNVSGVEVVSRTVSETGRPFSSAEDFNNGYGLLCWVNPATGMEDYYIVDTQGTVNHLTYYQETTHGVSSVSEEGLMWSNKYNDSGYTTFTFINTQGETVISTEYNSVATAGFQEGLCAVSSQPDGLWGFIDTEGNQVIPEKFYSFTNFSEGIAGFQNDEGKWGYMDKNGTQIIAPTYDQGFLCSGGYISVGMNQKYGLIDTQGNQLTDFIYDATKMSVDGYTVVMQGTWNNNDFSGKYGLLGENCVEILPCTYDKIAVIQGTGNALLAKDGVFFIESIANLSSDYIPPAAPTVTPTMPDATYAPWATTFVEFASQNNLLVDSLGNDYTVSITRLQIADLLVNMIEQYTGETLQASSESFSDTSNTQILKAYGAGIISGRGNGIFDPSATATRQEMAIMVLNSIKTMEKISGTSLIDHSLTTIEGFSDLDSAWGKETLSVLANAGIMSGSNGTINPNSNTSIEESLVMNKNIFQLS